VVLICCCVPNFIKITCIGQLPFLFFLALPNVVQTICRAQTCANSDVEPSRSAKAFPQGGPKSSKKFEIFTISRLYVHISQKRLTIEAYKQRTEKRFIPALSNCRMCMDPSLTGFYRVSQQLSDVIPVLRITPRATEPVDGSLSRLPFLLSSASSCAVAYVHRPAHILALSHSGWPRGFHRVGQKVRKNSNF